MSYKVKNLFDLQTNIGLNYILTNLLKFFLNPKATEIQLYETIIPIRSITRTDLKKAGKKIPNTFKYALWIKRLGNKVIFLLRAKNYSEIEIYNLNLTVSPPNISTLKNIAKILATNYKPIPTKVDKEFSKLAKTYSDYLDYFDVKRQWNSGYEKKRKSTSPTTHMSTTERNTLYEEFYKDLNRLAFEYRVISKIVIDIYRNKEETIYTNKDHTYQLIVCHVKPHKILIKLKCLFENFSYHEIIPLNKYERNYKLFKKDESFYNNMLSCVAPTLNA